MSHDCELWKTVETPKRKKDYEGLPEAWIAEGKLVFVEKQTHKAV